MLRDLNSKVIDIILVSIVDGGSLYGNNAYYFVEFYILLNFASLWNVFKNLTRC